MKRESELVPPVDVRELPEPQLLALLAFKRGARPAGFYREDGAFVHGSSVTITAWADRSETDVVVVTNSVGARIAPDGTVSPFAFVPAAEAPGEYEA